MPHAPPVHIYFDRERFDNPGVGIYSLDDDTAAIHLTTFGKTNSGLPILGIMLVDKDVGVYMQMTLRSFLAAANVFRDRYGAIDRDH